MATLRDDIELGVYEVQAKLEEMRLRLGDDNMDLYLSRLEKAAKLLKSIENKGSKGKQLKLKKEETEETEEGFRVKGRLKISKYNLRGLNITTFAE